MTMAHCVSFGEMAQGEDGQVSGHRGRHHTHISPAADSPVHKGQDWNSGWQEEQPDIHKNKLLSQYLLGNIILRDTTRDIMTVRYSI